MRFFQTMGEPVPLPGSFVFQRTFSVWLHFVGGVAVGETPVPSGPRHCAQSPGEVGAALTARSTAARRGAAESARKARRDVERCSKSRDMGAAFPANPRGATFAARRC